VVAKNSEPTPTFVWFGWTRDGLKAVLSRQRLRSRQRGRGKAAMSLTDKAESSRRGRLNSRQGRGEASQTVWQSLVAPPSWVEVIYVIPLYGVSRGLNLNLSSVGGRSLKLTEYRAEARPRQKLWVRAEAVRSDTEARQCEAETRPSRLKTRICAAEMAVRYAALSCVPKSTSVTLAVDERTLPMATITGRTDRQSATQYAAPS